MTGSGEFTDDDKVAGGLTDSCLWRQDADGNWDTQCGNAYVFIEGGPKDNQFVFCPYCGGELGEEPYDEQDLEP